MMIRVLIVDDEPLVRMGIKSTLSMCNCDIEIAGEVANGLKAVEIMKKAEVDLVLTDIKMPEMNGVELIKWIRQNNPGIKAVVLSCYNDFEYVREAFTFGALDYILKYDIEVASINNIIKRVKNEIERERKEVNDFEEINKWQGKNDTNLKVLKNDLMKELFRNGYSLERTVIEEQFRKLGFNIEPEGQFRVVCLDVYNTGDFDSRRIGKSSTQYTHEIINAVSEYLKKVCSFEIFAETMYRYLIIMDFSGTHNKPHTDNELLEIINHVQHLLFKYLNISVSIGVSGELSGYFSLTSLYQQALTAVEQKFFKAPGHIEFFYENKHSMGSAQSGKGINNLKAKVIKEIAEENFYEIINLLEQIKEEILSCEDISILEAKLAYVSFMEMIKVQYNKDLQNLNPGRLEDLNRNIMQMDFLEEIHELVVDIIIDLTSVKVGTLSKKDYCEAVLKAINYVNMHYSNESLGLNHIADKIGYSSSYLSRIFRQETGKYIVDYINEVRVQQAKKMLENPKNKVYQVAEKLGYNNYNYFSKVFKRFTGISPSEYSGKNCE